MDEEWASGQAFGREPFTWKALRTNYWIGAAHWIVAGSKLYIDAFTFRAEIFVWHGYDYGRLCKVCICEEDYLELWKKISSCKALAKILLVTNPLQAKQYTFEIFTGICDSC